MKITIKLPKPRNLLALAAKSKKAGAHAAHHPARRVRRIEKHHLRLALLERKAGGEQDA